MSSPAPATAASRLAFLDVARCLAIVLMVFAHVTDSIVAPDEWRSTFGELYAHVRGVTAPLFLLVSGWAFSAATLPKFSAHHRFGAEVRSRLRRVAVLMFWGSALTLPWWAPGFPFNVQRELWTPFLSFGVLHCVAGSLLGGQLLVRVASTPRAFASIALAAGLAAIIVGPFAQSVGEGLPVPLRGGFFAGNFGGGYPLLPWAGFFWLGAAAGAFAWCRKLSDRTTGFHVAAASALFFALSYVAQRVPHLESAHWTAANPALMFQRLGVGCAILAALAMARPVSRELASALRIPSKHALTFYVGHMLFIWGMPFVTGIHHRLGQTQSFASSAMLSAAYLVATWIVLRLAKPTVDGVKQWFRVRPRALSPDDVLRSRGITLSRANLTVNGRPYRLDDRTRFEAEALVPRLRAAIVALVCGTAGIPAALVYNAITTEDYSWLVAFPTAFVLGASYRILTADARYRVVVRTGEAAMPILETADEQLVMKVLTALREMFER